MRLHRNIYLWYVTTFFTSAAFTLPIWVIFNTNVLGLNYTQAFILGVLPYGLSAVFEVPTGTWADKYGRAKTFRIGTALYALSIASYIFTPDFYTLLIFQTIGGLGLAMMSGGLEALVHDSIEESNDKDIRYSQIHGRKMAILFISRVVTALLGGWLFTVDPRAPIVAASASVLAGLLISLLFTEVRTETPSTSSSYKHIRETLSLMITKRTLVLLFSLIIIFTFTSEALFALYQPYFQSIRIEVGEFGIFYAIISFFSALGALSITSLVEKFGVFRVIVIMMTAVLLSLSLLLLRIPALTYVLIIPSAITFGFVITLINTSVQKLISSKHQATALSIGSFVNTFTYMTASISVGLALDFIDVHHVVQILVFMAILGIIPAGIISRKRLHV